MSITIQSAKPKRASSQFFGGDTGLTLVELLVVLAILALVAGLAAPQVLRYLGSARTEVTKTQINNLVSAVELFYLDVGKYPTNDEGLKALVSPPNNTPKWKGPYLRKAKTALNDAWGNPYLYKISNDRQSFEIISLGQDGRPGGTGANQDISSAK